ncbi:lipid II:glycine glycyltransferase FemX [Fructobacillus evanidus]|uniref:Lipid II:glycine glycyltransferase (Peptidoglycan interpeptide bridge formation enzyme) (FmhB) n=1 Tax=Fructobacillus evanidus TaxID=3064281 RepID=A0ABM9MT78_9LACO|nr:Lipid II:glycine glycyltransferase (Peptidoglycan interpeptide bridge formation enzyme) (FmhB) [Fructobacillus sp. LMG 32999]CAK1234779.1 Lipid II:glycine glycyltransferase (Peptidoglycan interpeptide bridge formation enzyme) (FmhB) [Fructobacillus sp. LMG 32999]CAK1234930.1 Lipid II:glycine glycyltransferase (Peptidoglycan interpeptide bridge formation enzyme) (FmhB) [Fructobacillus sp. LMG 32999]CAK1235639.1 Lipid II:glycine glycyltransferase (Peptidoglycan interpeptide bridge formation enz
MTVLDLTQPSQVQRYQDFVKTAAKGQVTQDPLWGDLKANWGHLYLYHENQGGDIDAAMAVLTVEAVPGKLLAYCPKGPVADVTNVALVKELVQEALANLPENVFLVRMDPEVLYNQDLDQAYQDAGFVTRNVKIENMHGNIQPRKNVVLFYDGRGEGAQPITDEASLMKHFKSDYRNQIRRAIKDGVTVTSGRSKEDIEAFFKTYTMMAKAQGITRRPIEYFYRMQELWADSDLFRVFLAHYDGQVIAAGIGFGYGEKIWYMYAGSNREFAKHYGPYLVQWEMLKWGLSLGKVAYDFGGVGEFDHTDGLYKFKHGFAYHDPQVAYIGELDWVVDQAAYQKYLEQFA